MRCLDDNQVTRFLEQDLDGASEQHVERHLHECGDCRKLVTDWARSFGAQAQACESKQDEGSRGTDAAQFGAKRFHSLAPGTTLHRYTLLHRIGRGSMGTVYAAYDPKLDRKVALKLLHPTETGDSPPVGSRRDRMFREAQAMARLSHANVVSVHDVGTWGQQVFLTMEYVAGETLRHWLGTKPRDWSEVLGVYRQAGSGLEAAHAAGLVHRDFKPDNVLIDERGVAHVTDFGLARAVDFADTPALVPESTELRDGDRPLLEISISDTGVLAGTPAYMSPEQHDRLSADPRSDLFSFCVALYESLYGVRPFPGRSLQEIRARIAAGDVTAPAQETRTPAWLRRTLMRGMSAAPSDRFPSMSSLLQALEPRSARRRILAVVGLLLIAGAGLTLFLSSADNPQCTNAGRELDRAWNQERRATLAHRFQASDTLAIRDAWKYTDDALTAYADQWMAMRRDACEATRVRGEQSEVVLSLRTMCLDRRLVEFDAVVEILASGELAVLDKATEMSHALTPLETCADTELLYAYVRPPTDAATREQAARVQRLLAEAKALGDAGKYSQAISTAEQATAEALELDYAPVVAEARYLLGALQAQGGHYEQGADSLYEAIFAAEAAAHDEVLARAWIMLVWVVGPELARHKEAEQCIRHARALLDRSAVARQYEAKLEYFTGILRSAQGKSEEAKEHLERALATSRTGLERARILGQLGGNAKMRGDYDKAYELVSEGLEIHVAELGEHHPHVGLAMANLALVAQYQGNYQRAQELYTRALKLLTAALGPDNIQLANTINNLGNLYDEIGDVDQALVHWRRALVLRENAFGREHPKVANSLSNVGIGLTRQGKSEQALEYYQAALEVQEKLLGPAHPGVATSLNNIAVQLMALQRYGEALESLGRALGIVEKTLGADHPFAASIHLNIGNILVERGEYSRADKHLQDALRIRETVSGPDHPNTADTLGWIGDAYLARGDLDKAIAAYSRALQIDLAASGQEHPALISDLTELGVAYLASNDVKAALPLLEQAHELCALHPDDDALQYAQTSYQLARALWRADPKRASSLAQKARDTIAAQQGAVGDTVPLAEIERWIRSHPVR